MKRSKRIISIVAAVCVATGIQIPLSAKTQETAVSVDGNVHILKSKPYENSLGLMTDARSLADAFGLEYEFDAENKSFIMDGGSHGEIILVHNATEFYSGDGLFECLPYFYVENGVPMVETGFFCEMFGKSYTYTDGMIEVSDGFTPVLSSVEEDTAAEEGGLLSGSVAAENSSLIGDGGLDVILTIKSRTKAKYNHYGVPNYTLGESYDLGELHLDKGNAEKEFSYDVSQYYSEDYPCYTLFYSAGDAHYIPRYGYFANDKQFKVMQNPYVMNTVLRDSEEFDMTRDYTGLKLVLPVTAGETENGITWRLDRLTGELSLSGDGTVTADMPWSDYKNLIKSLTLGWGNIDIGEGAFSGYTSLEKVTMNGYTSKINERAFYGCTSLKTVSLSVNTKTVGNRAFENCVSLEAVSFPDWEGFGEIGERAFYNCAKLSDITMPPNIERIGSSAFSQCASLSNIKLPDGLASIPESAFEGCSMLKSVEIPESVLWIGSYAFYNCTSLESVTLPGALKTLRNGVFLCCSSLKEAEIPQSVNSMGNMMFKNCYALERVVMPDDITLLPIQSFYCCRKLRSVNIPRNLVEMEGYVFYGCESLAEIELNDKLETMGDFAFEKCALRSVTLPESVTKVGNFAFSECKQLEEIAFNKGLRVIANGVFEDCKSLETVTFPSNISVINTLAFNRCPKLKEMHFQGGAPSVGDYIVSNGQVVNVYYTAENEMWFGVFKQKYPDFIYSVEEITQTPSPAPESSPPASPAVQKSTPEPTVNPDVTEEPISIDPTPMPVPEGTAATEMVDVIYNENTDKTNVCFTVYNKTGENADVYAAVYNSDGRLLGVRKIEMNKNREDYYESFDGRAVYAKVFVWGSGGVNPLALTASEMTK